MKITSEINSPKQPNTTTDQVSVTRMAVGLIILVVTGFVFWVGFRFLRDTTAPQVITALIAIIWGVGGVAALFTGANMLVESFSATWQRRIQPYIFIGPAVAMLGWFLFVPTLRTLYQSFFNADTTSFVGLDNYIATFTDRQMLESYRNNLIWLFLGTGACVALGLLVAVLADRSKFETLAKALIFMPMAISFVGAGVIFKFIYTANAAGEAQIGLLNAIVVGLGGTPQTWLSSAQPWNNLFLIIVLIWMQTGFSMVIFSSALKSVPDDLLEAARIDGANEVDIFFKIIIPYIKGTIITVTTTIAIFTLKIFDVVSVMTGGNFGTDVVATQFFRQYSVANNYGYGSAIAMVLFLAVVPVMIYNIRQLRNQEAF